MTVRRDGDGSCVSWDIHGRLKRQLHLVRTKLETSVSITEKTPGPRVVIAPTVLNLEETFTDNGQIVVSVSIDQLPLTR
jgi:hypothetical protein